MKVLLAAAEVFPLVKTGGLADVVGAMPEALISVGVDARLLLPGLPSVLLGMDDLALVCELGPLFGAVQRGEPLARCVEMLIDGSGGRQGCFAAQPPWIRQIELDNAATVPHQLQQPASREVTRADLQRLACPVVLGRGARTAELFAVATDGLAQALPGARHEVLDDAGHLLPLEQPQRFAQWVLDGLAAVRA